MFENHVANQSNALFTCHNFNSCDCSLIEIYNSGRPVQYNLSKTPQSNPAHTGQYGHVLWACSALQLGIQYPNTRTRPVVSEVSLAVGSS